MGASEAAQRRNSKTEFLTYHPGFHSSVISRNMFPRWSNKVHKKISLGKKAWVQLTHSEFRALTFPGFLMHAGTQPAYYMAPRTHGVTFYLSNKQAYSVYGSVTYLNQSTF